MVLFSVVTSYQLVNALIFKQIYYTDVKGVLFISSYRAANVNVEGIKTIFEEVITFDTSYNFTSKGRPDTIVSIPQLLTKYGYCISDFTDIYVAGAHFSMGVYLIQNDISFCYFEEAAGILSNPKQLEDIDRGLNQARARYAKEEGLYDGSNKLITKCIGNSYAQKVGFERSNFEHFDPIEALGKLNKVERDKIINIFLSNNNFDFNITSDAVIIFSQHFANLKIHTIEEQALIYQMFIDYFYMNKVCIIKTHPDDILFYGRLFPNVIVIRDKFPAEFIPYIFTNKPKEVATICSTAVDNLKRYFSSFFSLDYEYGHTKAFLSTHKVYIALSYISMFKNDAKLFINGYPLSIFKGFIQKCFTDIVLVDTYGDADIVIVDDFDNKNTNILLEYLHKNPYKAIIYLAFYGTYLDNIFYNSTDYSIGVINIKKSVQRSEYVYQDLSDEIIYTINLSREFNMMKELKNTGIKLEVSQLTDHEIRIKVLEGIVNAMEQRLCYVLDENKSLKAKLGEKL